jgi:hypothetical protein
MEPKHIDIEQFDLANEKVSEKVHLYIELGDNYFLYTAEYYAEQPKAEDKDDHTFGWEDIYANFRIKIKREAFVSVDINWIHKRELWCVELEANGYPNTVKLYFKKQRDAETVCKALDEYIFN